MFEETADNKKAAPGGFFMGFARLNERRQNQGWCGRRDSNSYSLRRWNLNPVCLPISPRPRGALKAKAPDYTIKAPSRIWGGRWESNPRHQEPQSCALPTELRPPYCGIASKHHLLCQSCLMAHPAGLEPATIRLEGGCSIQLSYGRIFNLLSVTIANQLSAVPNKLANPLILPDLANQC